MKKINLILLNTILIIIAFFNFGCENKNNINIVEKKDPFYDEIYKKIYIAPGEKDEFYWFMSGGFSGNVTVHAIPSGKLIKTIPVFSVFPENGYGYDEETKNMLMTSNGFVPWDDAHHPKLSITDGMPDGKWLFINGNNAPRIARINLQTFETDEIIEIPNCAGNHASPFPTENTEYLMSATRFSIPIPQNNNIQVSSAEQGAFKGTINMIKVEKNGRMNLELQILVPGYNYDLASCGKNVSKDWCFFTSYNVEQAYKMLEIEASRFDKDYILAFNWKKAEQCLKNNLAKDFNGIHYNNYKEESLPTISIKKNKVKLLDPKDCPGVMFFLPTPKSPHGVDVDPSGEFIVAGGKLASLIPVHSFSKLENSIKEEKNFIKIDNGIPVLNYESTIIGEVKKPCLGPLHTEFDNNGFAYTSCFIDSDVVKWKLKTWEIIEKAPSYYSIGHLSIAGGDTKHPIGKFMITLNKITKDRFLPVGPELCHSAQLYDISGNKMKLLLDFPTMGEPHYAQGIEAKKLINNSKQYFNLEENKHPFACKNEDDVKIIRNNNILHVSMTAIRSHFKPDIIEAKKGDTIYFHVTNLEQEFDIPHGFAVQGAQTSNILIMPGQTRTVKFTPKNIGIYPFYCTDFCSALHQEMQQYIRISE